MLFRWCFIKGIFTIVGYFTSRGCPLFLKAIIFSSIYFAKTYCSYFSISSNWPKSFLELCEIGNKFSNLKKKSEHKLYLNQLKN